MRQKVVAAPFCVQWSRPTSLSALLESHWHDSTPHRSLNVYSQSTGVFSLLFCVEDIKETLDVQHISLQALNTTAPVTHKPFSRGVLAFYCKTTCPPISHCRRVQIQMLRRILRMGAVRTPWLAPLRNSGGSTALLNKCIMSIFAGPYYYLTFIEFYTRQANLDPLLYSPFYSPLRSVFYRFSVEDSVFDISTQSPRRDIYRTSSECLLSNSGVLLEVQETCWTECWPEWFNLIVCFFFQSV